MQSIFSLISPSRWYLEFELKKLRTLINKEKFKVLEIGCGNSSYKCFFPSTDWIATDLIKTKCVDEIADVLHLKYKENSFDVVFCLSVLEHVFDFNKAISEMYRVLKKDGLLVLSTPFIYPLHDFPNDYWRFTSSSLKIILNSFKDIKIKNLPCFWWRIPISYFVIARK